MTFADRPDLDPPLPVRPPRQQRPLLAVGLIVAVLSLGAAPAPRHSGGRRVAKTGRGRSTATTATMLHGGPGGLIPLRSAKQVSDVAKPYAAHWIVRPNEELRGDHRVRQYPETDIRAVSAANDPKRLRIDIFLHNPVGQSKQVVYVFKIIYRWLYEEWFIYSPHDGKFELFEYRGPRLLRRRVLKQSATGDKVELGETTRGRQRFPRQRVTLYLDKDKHFSPKRRGQDKYITMQVFAGFYYPRSRRLRLADRTPVTKLVYKR